MDALRKDTPAHLTQQHTFTFPFELLPDGQERPRFLPPRPSDRQSRSTTKHSQPFEVEGESSPRNGERNRERERIANRAMRRQRETKLKFFRSPILGCAWYVEQSWEKIVGRINERGGLGQRILNFRYETRDRRHGLRWNGIILKVLEEEVSEKPSPWNARLQVSRCWFLASSSRMGMWRGILLFGQQVYEVVGKTCHAKITMRFSVECYCGQNGWE